MTFYLEVRTEDMMVRFH